MKTVRKALSSEDEGRQIFRQNQQNYRLRGINSWQEKSLPIGWFSGCKESSRLRDTESWLYLMNLITCLIYGPSGERKFLLGHFYRNHEKVVGFGGLLMSYLKDCSLFSLLNSSKPTVQCTNKRLGYLVSKIPSRREGWTVRQRSKSPGMRTLPPRLFTGCMRDIIQSKQTVVYSNWRIDLLVISFLCE